MKKQRDAYEEAETDRKNLTSKRKKKKKRIMKKMSRLDLRGPWH